MSAILENPETLKDAFESANNAAGSALRENEKYLDSIQGRIDLFSNAIQTMWSTELNSNVVKMFVDLGTSLVKVVDKLGLINTLVFGLMSYLTVFKKNKYDFASMLGIHSIEDGWFNKKNKNDNILPISQPATMLENMTGEQVDIFSEEYKTQIQLNEKIKQLQTAKGELQSLKRTKWKDIQIPKDAITYTTGNRRRTYLNEVLIPNKEQEIAAIEKDIDDITRSAEIKINQSKTKLKEDANGQLMFDVDNGSKSTSKYFNVFENGLAKGATEKLTYDTRQLGIELDKLNGMDNTGIVNYMQNLDNLEDVGEDTRLTLAAYASTVEDGNYTLQGAQKYVNNYNQSLAKLSKEATIAQFKQNMLNLAISTMAMVLTALIAKLIESAASSQDEFEKLSSQLSSTKSELDNINSELKNTKEKIEELQKQGSLSFTDQEELERLREQNKELERQKELKESIQSQQQKGVNSASVKAANDYYKKTGKNSGKTTGEIAGQGAQYGAMAGGAIAAAGGATALGGSITAALAAAGTTVAPGVGTLIGVLAGLVITGVSAAVGAGIGAGIGAAEEKVGESMDNMHDQYSKLQEEYDAAQSEYANKASDNNYEKMQKAQEKLTEYESAMANHLAEMDAYYSQIDLSVYDQIKDAAEIERLRNEMNEFYDTQDKWLIQSGGKDAKSNAITRIFGENASEKLKNFDQQIKNMVSSGEEFDFYDKFDNAGLDDTKLRLDEMGISLTDLKYYYLDWANSESEVEDNTYNTVKSVGSLTSSISALKDAFSEFNENGLVTADTLVELYDTFGQLGDAWDNYVNVMATGTASTKEAKEATLELLESLMNQHLEQGPIKDMKEYLALISQLQHLGVGNAKDYVDALQKSSMISGIGKSVSNDTSGKSQDELIQQYTKQYEEDYGITLSDDEKLAIEKAITAEKTKQAATEAQTKHNKYEEAVRQKEEAVRQKEEAEQQVKKVEEKLNEYEYDGNGLYRKGEFGSPDVEYIGEYEYDKIAETGIKAQEAVNEAQDKIDAIEIPTDVDADSAEQAAEDAKDIFDQTLDKLGLTLEIELYNSTQAVDDIQSIFDTLASAQKEYREEGYFTVDTLQSLIELEPKYLALLYDENGNLNLNKDTLYQVAVARITDMKLKQQDMILSEAEKLATEGTIDALYEQIDATYGMSEAYDVMIAQRLQNIRSILEERKALKDGEEGKLADSFDVNGYISSIQHQLDAVEWSATSSIKNIQNSLSSSGNTAKSEADDAFKKAMDYWENRLSANQARYDQLQNEIDLIEKKGGIAGKEYYEEQIKLENERLRLLEAQKAEAQKFLGTFKEGSDEWWEVASTLNDIESDIDSVTSSIQDLNDAIDQIHWDVFDESHERFGDLISQLETVRDLLSADEDQFFDDEGQWTEKGVAALGTYIQEIEIYKNALKDVNDELANLKIEDFDSEQEYY